MSGPLTWHWRKLEPCDLDEMSSGLNPQMKSLERRLARRPEIMAGFPEHVGAIVDNDINSHTGDTDETTLKTTSFGRGAISSKGGFRVSAAGTTTGGAAIGDWVELVDIATNQWAVRGQLTHSGIQATPFSATVS